MRVLVCGGRNYDNYGALATLLSALQVTREPFDVLIHGNAQGADMLADTYARRHNIPVMEFNADWKRHGKSAGPRRNRRMIVEGKPDLVVAFPGRNGTTNMVAQARAAGIEVITYLP